jgi:hypothetical protein
MNCSVDTSDLLGGYEQIDTASSQEKLYAVSAFVSFVCKKELFLSVFDVVDDKEELVQQQQIWNYRRVVLFLEEKFSLFGVFCRSYSNNNLLSHPLWLSIIKKI